MRLYLFLLILASASLRCASGEVSSSSGGSSSNGGDSAPSSRLPWVLLPKNLTAFDGRVYDGDCVGLLVSPTAALMAASCIGDDASAIHAAAVALAEGSAVEAGDLAEPGLPHWRLQEPVTVTMHPQAKENSLVYNFAIVRWRDPISSPTVPVVLDTMGDKRLNRPEDSTKETLVVLLGVTETEEVIRRSSTACVTDFASLPVGGLVCLEATWSSGELCAEVSRQNGFLRRSAFDRVVISGIVAQNVNCGLSNISTAPTTSHAGVSLLTNAREFIDQTLDGHMWLETLAVSSSLVPPNATTDEEDWYGAQEDPLPDETLPAPWRQGLSQDKAYLSPEAELLVDPRNLEDGGFGVMIAPQFLLTRASWIRGLQTIQYAHFGLETIPIQRVIMKDPAVARPGEQLVVVEIAREPQGVMVAPLATVLPAENVDFMMLQTTVMSEGKVNETDEYIPAIEFSVNYNARVSRSVCQSANLNNDLLCVQSSDRLGSNADAKRYLPFNTSLLTVGDSLLALSLGSTVMNAEAQAAQTYEPLGSDPRTRTFLDQATNGTVVWSEEDISSQEPENVPVGRILLYRSDPTTEDGVALIPCGGVIIAPQFLLTTASCLGENQVAWAMYESPQAMKEVKLKRRLSASDAPVDRVDGTGIPEAVETSPSQAEPPEQGDGGEDDVFQQRPRGLPDEAITVASVYVHPQYKSSQPGAPDFAIIQLQDACFLRSLVVNLWAEPLSSMSRVIEHKIDNDEAPDEASVVVDSTECHLGQADALLCVGPAVLSVSSQCTSNQTRTLFHRVGETVVFVGFSHPPATDCSARRKYSQVSLILNFVNAVVDTPQWGSSRHVVTGYALRPKQPEPTPASAPLSPKPYVVGLRMTKDGQNFCGGSLISSQFVLTAAHCVSDGLAKWVSIGSVDSAGLNTEPIAINTERTRIHPQYKSPYRYSHDAAILELSVAAYAEPITLDAATDFKDGNAAVMYGYGVDSADSTELSSTMHARDLSLLSTASCKRTLPDIDDSVLCALAANGLDACTGDSGSPLVIKDATSGREQLVGVVSAGYGCGVAGVPGLYMRAVSVSSFINAYAVDTAWVGSRPGLDDTSPPSASPSPSSAPSPARQATKTPVATTEDRSSGSSQPTDLSELPLEERNSQVTGPPSSTTSPSPPVYSPTLPSTTGGGFDKAIVKTPLPSSFSAHTEAALMQFLLGDYAYLLVPPSLLQAISSPRNSLTLFSSGDVRELLRVLSKHDATPLNQRKDRFQTAESATSCTGH